MTFTDDEIVLISALLYKSKSKLIDEFSELKFLKGKIHEESQKITARRARLVIKPGDWS